MIFHLVHRLGEFRIGFADPVVRELLLLLEHILTKILFCPGVAFP